VTVFRVLVVDDERPARATVARLLAGDPRFTLEGEAASGLEALDAIDALHPNLVVLDIQMPAMNGFEMLEALGGERDFALVFSTASDAHALRAFDEHALDYLLKPYDGSRFRRALDRAFTWLAAESKSGGELVDRAVRAALGEGPRRRLVVRTASGWVSVPVADLTRISAANKRVTLHLGAEALLANQSLGSMVERLDPDRFVRVHRSEVVNVDAVARVEPWSHGDAILVLRDGSSVVLSRTYRHAFFARFRS
jgi:two-component system, LytTR family, response regulator